MTVERTGTAATRSAVVRRVVEHVFRISVHLLAGAAAVMLAAAEGTPFPTLFTVPIAFFAFVMTSGRRRFHLSSLVANLLGAIAVGLAAAEFFGGGQVDSRLRAGVHLLVYLSWIVLLQQRTDGQYWWICALTVLQAAVGTLLVEDVDSGRYGTWLAGYALLAIWTLTVFSVHRAYVRIGSVTARDGDGLQPTTTGPSLRGISRTGDAITEDVRSRVFGGRFLFGVVSTTAGSLVVAVIVFLLFPRIYVMEDAFGGVGDFSGRQPLTGFSESVQLGEMGAILESREKVLEVRVVDERTGVELDVERYARQLGHEEPLFRGKVLAEYSSGKWTAERERTPGQFATDPIRGALSQEYRLNPIGTDVLFVMQPTSRVVLRDGSNPSGAFIAPATSTMRRPGSRRRADGIEYVAYSPRFAAEESLVEFNLSPQQRFRHLDGLLEHPRLSRIEAFAADDLRALQTGEVTPVEIAQNYNRYLQSEGGYAYSLQGGGVERGVDPVEHFLFETKTGHCEYYASALALMLREVNIPARVVTGFKGGTKNRLTGYFEVEQRHAHAWVEAYVTDEPVDLVLSRIVERENDWARNLLEQGVPRERVAELREDRVWRAVEREVYETGRWVVFDPTPSLQRSESVASNAGEVSSWGDLRSYVTNQWDWYVLRMNALKQNRQFYWPIRNFLVEVWRTIRGDEDSRRALWRRLVEIVTSPGEWFSPFGFVVTFLVLTLAYAMFRALLALVRLVGRLLGIGRKDERGPVVEFYERLLRACRRLGLERRGSQTHFEFATEVADRLKAMSGAASHAFPQEVLGEFLAVRFGGRIPTPERVAALEERLGEFEEVVNELVASESAGGIVSSQHERTAPPTVDGAVSTSRDS